MRRAASASPSHRRQKRRGGSALAVVEIKTNRHYAGVYSSRESRQAYHRLLAEVSGNEGEVPSAPPDITVVVVADWRHNWVRSYYVKNGVVWLPPTSASDFSDQRKWRSSAQE